MSLVVIKSVAGIVLFPVIKFYGIDRFSSNNNKKILKWKVNNYAVLLYTKDDSNSVQNSQGLEL